MLYRRALFIGYLFTIVSSFTFVEGVPKPMEFLVEVKNSVLKRLRRSSVNFHNAIRCYQPKVLILGTYGNYGCFCGFAGKGEALDETDKCCKAHDNCYEEADNVERTFWESLIVVGGEIFRPYSHECVEGGIVCAQNSPYQGKLCECDKTAAECFHKACSTYHPGLFNVDQEKYCKANSSLKGLNFTVEDLRVPRENQSNTTPLTTSRKNDQTNEDSNKIKNKNLKQHWLHSTKNTPAKSTTTENIKISANFKFDDFKGSNDDNDQKFKQTIYVSSKQPLPSLITYPNIHEADPKQNEHHKKYERVKDGSSAKLKETKLKANTKKQQKSTYQETTRHVISESLVHPNLQTFNTGTSAFSRFNILLKYATAFLSVGLLL